MVQNPRPGPCLETHHVEQSLDAHPEPGTRRSQMGQKPGPATVSRCHPAHHPCHMPLDQEPHKPEALSVAPGPKETTQPGTAPARKALRPLPHLHSPSLAQFLIDVRTVSPRHREKELGCTPPIMPFNKPQTRETCADTSKNMS